MSNFVAKFTQQKEKLKDLAKELLNEGFLKSEDIKKIEDILNNEKIKIAVIGQMKYGKSTFINSLIFGKEFLPTSSTPMTAALSEIKYGNKDIYEVTFFTPEEFEEMEKVEDEVFQETISKAKALGRELYRLLGNKKTISPDEFENYVGADGKYTPIVKMLTIKTPNDILKEAIVVDTPGFNDPVKSRDEIAFKFIEEADFIILFLYAGRPFDNTDREIIINKLQNAPLGKLIVVVNKADTLLEEHGTFKRVKKYVEEKYKTAVNEGIASPNFREMLLSADIIPISSLMALLGKMDMSEIEKDENLKWYYDKFKEEFGNISQEDMLKLSNIEELENNIKEGIEKEKNKILISKVKQQIITPLRLKLGELQTQKLNIEQDLENLDNFEDIESKKELIDKFMNEEFDEITDTFKILNSIKKMAEGYKKETLSKIDNFEKDVLKAIGTLVDEYGKEKGVEALESNFRQFNVEIKQDIREHIMKCVENMQDKVNKKIDDIFEYLKHHQLSSKFKIKVSDINKLKENMLFLQTNSIEKAIKDIKLDLPKVDMGLIFGDSKKEIKNKFYDFSDEYFDGLKERINSIYNMLNEVLSQKLGNKSEIKTFLEQRLIEPLERSISRIQQEINKNKNLKQELQAKLKDINKEINILENKIAEVENKLKG